MRNTVENIINDYRSHAEVSHRGDFVAEESLLLHSHSFNGNTCDARVSAYLRLPDGSEWECDKVIKVRFKKVKRTI